MRLLKTFFVSVIFVAALTSIGCGCRIDQPHVSRQQAMVWDDLLTVRVIKVHDLMKCHVSTAPHLSHLVEVQVIEGPQQYLGRTLILPFDNYEATERTPPEADTEVSVIPAMWVRCSRKATDYRRF